MKCPVSITVNASRHTHEVEPRLLLVHFLRETLGLTGTNVGCDTSQCGACTVLLNGRAVKSCTVLAVQADGAAVTTVEGLAQNGKLHPLQEAFWEKHGLQCGFCTPGMLMTACDLLERTPNPTRGADPPRPRRQLLPLHRLPEHRGLDQDRGRRDGGAKVGGENGHPHLRLRDQAPGRPPPHHRPGEVHGRLRSSRDGAPRGGALPVRPRPHQAHRRDRGQGAARGPRPSSPART